MDKYGKDDIKTYVEDEREVSVEKATNETTALVKEQREAINESRKNTETDRTL